MSDSVARFEPIDCNIKRKCTFKYGNNKFEDDGYYSNSQTNKIILINLEMMVISQSTNQSNQQNNIDNINKKDFLFQHDFKSSFYFWIILRQY